MSSYESYWSNYLKGEPPSDPFDFELPEDPSDIDEEWIAMFNQIYGGESKRATLYTVNCIRQKLSGGCVPENGRRRYETVKLSENNNREVSIDGSIVEVKLVPDFDEEGTYWPHVVLRDVEIVGDADSLVQHPRQEFWVPLSRRDSLTFYSETG